MAKVIALVGSKGGSGKSSTAHLIAHGAGSLPRPINAVVLTTDPEEEPRDDPRRYLVRDARTPALLLAELEHWLAQDRILVLVDGAAARPDLDAVVQDVADMALLPYKPAAQDAERAVLNLERLAKAVALPTAWPRHPGTARRVRRWLEMVPEKRRMAPFPALSKLDGLLSAEGYQAAAYDLAAPARGLVLEVLARAGIDPAELEEPRA